jgi:hypothetical protein
MESNSRVEDRALKGMATLCSRPFRCAALRSLSRTASAVSAVHSETESQFRATQLSPVLTLNRFSSSASGRSYAYDSRSLAWSKVFECSAETEFHHAVEAALANIA